MKESITVYHGSDKLFKTFSDEFIGTHGVNAYGNGFYFTKSLSQAKGYGKYVYKCKISAKNFYMVKHGEEGFIKSDELIKQGYDGICYRQIYTVFNAENIEIQEIKEYNLFRQLIRTIKPQELSEKSGNIKESLTVYHGGATKKETDGLKYYALDKKYVKLLHPRAKISQHEINPKNTFDYSNPKHVQMLLDKLPDKISVKDNYRNFQKEYTKEEFKKQLNDTVIGNWMELEDKTIQKIIKDLGFDSIYISDVSMSGKMWKNIAMFENKTSTKLKAYHGGNLDNGIHNGHLFFTDDIETAKLYGRDGSPDYKLYQCELEFENPLILSSEEYDEFMQSISDWSEPVKQGYDSIICKEDPEYNDPFYYVALNPVKQVKNLKEISKDSIKEDSNLNDKFYKWFGDSKVVDEQGNPLVVYHGTDTEFNVFDNSKNQHKHRQVGADLGFFFTDSEKVARRFIPKREVKFEIDYTPFTKEEYEDFGKNINNNWQELKTKYGEEKFFELRDAYWEVSKRIYKQKTQDKQAYGLKACYLKIENPAYIDGEIIGVGEDREAFLMQSRNNHDGVIISNADTGAGIANEYVVFNSNQIKSVDNNGNWSDSENIYEAGYDWNITMQEILDKLNMNESLNKDFRTLNKLFEELL